jgi:hypothetical protein
MKTLKVKRYTRTIEEQEKEFTCSSCGKDVIEYRYPGPYPTVCQNCLNNPDRQRELARERKRRQREREKALKTGNA